LSAQAKPIEVQEQINFVSAESFHMGELNRLSERLPRFTKVKEKEIKWGGDTAQKLDHDSIIQGQEREIFQLF
jgi:hypothetical protein